MKRIDHRSVRACLGGALAACACFGIVLAAAYVSCDVTGADCNPASFLVLPVVALVAGLPMMVILCAAVLLPLWWRQRRTARERALPFLLIGALPGCLVVVALVALAGSGGSGEILWMLVYGALGVGVPGVVGAGAFYATMRHYHSTA